MKYFALSLLLSLSVHSAVNKTYDCKAVFECTGDGNGDTECAVPGLRISLNNGVFKAAQDISYGPPLTFISSTTYKNLLSISGDDGDGLFYMQLDLRKLTNPKKQAGILQTSFGGHFKIFCEESEEPINSH